MQCVDSGMVTNTPSSFIACVSVHFTKLPRVSILKTLPIVIIKNVSLIVIVRLVVCEFRQAGFVAESIRNMRKTFRVPDRMVVAFHPG